MSGSSFKSSSAPLRCSAAYRWLDTPDGLRLRTGRWEPMRLPVATVIILPGRTAFIEKFEDVAEELTSRRIRVLALDWRGQGRSTRLLRNPQRGHVRHYDDYIADLDLFLNRIGRFAIEGKVFWLTHSMGSLIALLSLVRKQPTKLDGLIMAAPLTDLLTWPLARKAAQAMAAFACKAGFAETYAFGQGDYSPRAFEGNPITKDRTRFEQFQQWLAQEPALQLGGATFGWLNATFQAFETLHRLNLSEVVKVPSLVLGTPEDPIVPFMAQQRLANRLLKCTLKTYPDAGHDVFLEGDPTRKQVWKDIDDFLSLQVPNYIGGGKDRVKPKTMELKPPKPPAWRPGRR